MRRIVNFAGAFVLLVACTPVFAQYSNKLSPYVATPPRVMDRMLELANIKSGETLYDLGCGDGRVLIAAVEKYKVKAIGVEISPRLAARATAWIKKAGVESQAQVIQGDLLKIDLDGLSNADVVVIYLGRQLNEALRPKLEARLKAGARVISEDYPVPGWKASRIDRQPSGLSHAIYVYDMPPTKSDK